IRCYCCCCIHSHSISYRERIKPMSIAPDQWSQFGMLYDTVNPLGRQSVVGRSIRNCWLMGFNQLPMERVIASRNLIPCVTAMDCLTSIDLNLQTTFVILHESQNMLCDFCT